MQNRAMPSFSRRRFLRIAAAALPVGLAVGLCPETGFGKETTSVPLRLWRGTALGAEAEIQLAHPDPAVAAALLDDAVTTLARLEQVFSLYRPDSALSRLNREGVLAAPPLDLVRLLGEAAQFHAETGGIFDVTVQPLWALYAAHFRTPGADPAGPPAAAVAAALARVDGGAVQVSAHEIRLRRPGMAITLNGIAQGYITDRVCEQFQAAGLPHVLTDLGEIRALGTHPENRPWQAAVEKPDHPGSFPRILPLENSALATSSGHRSRFDPAGRFHHLLHPRTGLSPAITASLTVQAATATTADALSTAGLMMDRTTFQTLVTAYGARAFF